MHDTFISKRLALQNMVPFFQYSQVILNKSQYIFKANATYIGEDSLLYMETEERTIFFIVFLVVYIIAFTGNAYAIYATWKKNHRCIQKACIISLALSDIVMATAYAINNLETFAHHIKIWTIGEFMCQFIPMLQIAGLIANCFTLVVIALDRYQNVVHALRKRWNPEMWKCIIGILFLWFSSGAIAYPMFTYFKYYAIKLVNSNKEISDAYLCLSNLKASMYHYYIIIASIIFLPTLAIFVFLYYNIAILIWKHRKPLHLRCQKNEETSPETSTSNVKSSETQSANNPQITKRNGIKQKNIHVERKIRTFKIIITLVLVFILCRLPFWIFTIMKLESINFNQPIHWTLTYCFTALTLLNCALNPFLYTFLDPTVKRLTMFCKAVNDFICQVCCFCFSNTEFDEFERENPFIIANYNRNRTKTHTVSGRNGIVQQQAGMNDENKY